MDENITLYIRRNVYNAASKFKLHPKEQYLLEIIAFFKKAIDQKLCTPMEVCSVLKKAVETYSFFPSIAELIQTGRSLSIKLSENEYRKELPAEDKNCSGCGGIGYMYMKKERGHDAVPYEVVASCGLCTRGRYLSSEQSKPKLFSKEAFEKRGWKFYKNIS